MLLHNAGRIRSGKRPKLAIPLPTEKRARDAIVKKYFTSEAWEEYYDASTVELKRMSDYSGYTFNELINLPIGAYLLIKKDSWIESMKATPEASEVLKNIYRLQQSKPDEAAIKRFTKGRKN